MKPAFEVDKAGLAKLLERRGKAFAALELLQNALDEDVTEVRVALLPTSRSRGYHTLVVEDDCPEGFADLAHAYTLFAESLKKGNPQQRGRFNLGEKLVLAVCRRAAIATTKGTIRWEGNKRTHSRACTAKGSTFTGELRMTREEAIDALEVIRRVLVPEGIKVLINGERLESREPIDAFEAPLPTEIADDEGYLRRTQRRCTVELYEPRQCGAWAGEPAMLYELGIPVVEIDCPWHVNVCQKVPLNTDRDNVTPAYMRRLLAEVLNTMHDQAPQEALRDPWVGEAMESDLVNDAAVGDVLTARYGEKRVIRDPSDPEGTKIAVTRGYQVIEPGSFNRAQWEAIRRSEAALPAGQVTPSPKPFDPEGEGEPLKLIPSGQWTDAQRHRVIFYERLAKLLIGHSIDIDLTADAGWGFLAAYGERRLTLNAGRLGDAWFERPHADEGVLELLIHELAHAYESDHLAEAFHEACCRLGARLAVLALDEPGLF
jgi:hypothetical protein